MKKELVLKLLVVVLMIGLVVGVSRSSFAVSTITALNSIENDAGGNGTNNVVNNISTNEPVNNIVVNNVSKNNTPVNNTVIPDTGANSSTGLFVMMGICALSAGYTFVRMRKYKI